MKTLENTPKTTTDPVCSMNVDPGKTDFVSDYKGRIYYFCAQKCHKTFVTNPRKYLEPKLVKRKGWWGRYLERVKNVTCNRQTQTCH